MFKLVLIKKELFKIKLVNESRLYKLKCNFSFPNIVAPKLQEKEIIPTKQKQNIMADDNYDGLSQVIVDSIPEEYIIPQGTKKIISNGVQEIKKYENVDVEVPTDNIYDYFYETPPTMTNYTELMARMIKKIPKINVSKIDTTLKMFYNFSSIEEIESLDISSSENSSQMFEGCTGLRSIGSLKTGNLKNSVSRMFYNCRALNPLPQIDTSKIKTFSYFLANCVNLKNIPELDFSSATNLNNAFQNCIALNLLGGFKNVGKAYLKTAKENNPAYTLNLSFSNSLDNTRASLNVINDLYDIKSAGVKNQQLILGSDNLSRLYAEQIEIATKRGWSVL